MHRYMCRQNTHKHKIEEQQKEFLEIFVIVLKFTFIHSLCVCACMCYICVHVCGVCEYACAWMSKDNLGSQLSSSITWAGNTEFRSSGFVTNALTY